MLKSFINIIDYIFPPEQTITPKDHAAAILNVLQKHKPSEQSDILLSLKESMITHRIDLIEELSVDLKKLETI